MKIAIARVENPVLDRGNGPMIAKRILVGASDMRSISPFLRLSEDWFQAPGGFDTHPHRGMQTVTFVLEGALHHRDHTGGEGVLHAGDVQWMTAGRGVLHSEMPWKDELAHTLQLWLNLPASKKMMPARYLDQPKDDVPIVTGDGYSLRVYAGHIEDVNQPHGSDWPMMLVDVNIKSGSRVALDVPADWRGFVYVIDGNGELGAQSTSVEPPMVAWFEPSSQSGSSNDVLAIKANSDFRCLLFAGLPIDEDVVAHGPFVMNTEDEIRQAFADYRAGQFTG